MAIDKLIPAYLNKDEDSRLVKSMEMTDSLNIRISSDDEGDSGVIKNAFGNTTISYADPSDELPSGVNRVIGSVTNKLFKEVYFFTYNSLGNHSIYRYSAADANVKLVYCDSVLGFVYNGFVKADYVINEDNEVLLYFNDGVNAPMKINVTRALSDVNYPGGVTDAEKLEYLTVAKTPPTAPPTFSFGTNASVPYNNIYKKFFQFAYQYIYTDGEVSAISPYSKLGISSDMYYVNVIDTDTDLNNNYIRVTVDTYNSEVQKIRVLARQGNTGAFFVIDELTNNTGVSTLTTDFYNDKAYSYVGSVEENKLFDNVPLKADSQTIAGNRLMYGGYTEGYANVSATSSGEFRYLEEGEIESLTASVPVASPTYNSVITRISTSNLPSQVKAGAVARLEMIEYASHLTATKTSGNYFSQVTWTEEPSTQNARPYALTAQQSSTNVGQIKLASLTIPINKTVTVTTNKTKAALINDILSAINGTYTVYIYPEAVTTASTPSDMDATYIDDDGDWALYFKYQGTISVTLTATYNSANDRIEVKHSILTSDLYPRYAFTYGTAGGSFPNTFGAEIRIQTGGYFTDALDSANSSTLWSALAIQQQNNLYIKNDSYTTFKSGVSHSFGIVYYDDRNRSGGVNDLGQIYCQRITERTTGAAGAANLIMRIKSDAPSWAKKWQLVYAPKTQYDKFLVYSVAEAFFKTTSDETNDRKIYVAMRHLEGKTTSYKDAKGANLEYTYAEGDVLRIVSYTEDGIKVFPKDYTFKVLGYEYFTASDNPISDTVADERLQGWFLVLRDANYLRFNAFSVNLGQNDASHDLWHHDTVVEILRRKKEPSENVYYEIGECFDVVNASGTYRHKGERDYSYTWSSGYGNITVSGGVATTSLNLFEGDLMNISSVDDSYTGVRVANIRSNFDGTISFPVSEVNNGSYALGIISNLTDAVLKVEEGDCYYVPRQIKFNYDPESHNIEANMETIRYENVFVESESISDFMTSDYINIGRANAKIKDAKQIKRSASITYSDPFVIDSSVLGLASFNLSTANFNDYSNAYGSIKYMHADDDRILCLQERKVSQIPVNRNIIEYANGGGNVAVSSNVLNTALYYAGDYGINSNPESFAEHFGRYFFSDIKSGKVLRLSADGMTPISDTNMTSYFSVKYALADSPSVKVLGGIDSENDEYIVSVYDIEESGIDFTVGYNYDDKIWSTFYSFQPERICSLDNTLYTFKNGRVYKHSSAATRNNFYGTQYSSVIEVVSNVNPSLVKQYSALSLEGNSVWSAVITNSDQTTSILTSDFSQREREYFAYISRDNTADVTSGGNITTFKGASEVFTLGDVDSTSGTTITFKNAVNSIAFPIGSSLYVVNGSQADTLSNTIASVSGRKSITCASTVSGLSSGDTVLAVANSGIEGDAIRDSFMKIRLTNTSTSQIELYSVNAVFTKSSLHNQLG